MSLLRFLVRCSNNERHSACSAWLLQLFILPLLLKPLPPTATAVAAAARTGTAAFNRLHVLLPTYFFPTTTSNATLP